MSQAVEPGTAREAGERVERTECTGSRQHAAQREGLRPRIPLLRVQLLACPAHDVPGGHPRRAGGNAVVAREAGGERSVRDVAELEATFHRVADESNASASCLPFHGIDHVSRTCGLAERTLVALARRLVDVGKEAGGRDGGAGHWGRIVDEIADHSTRRWLATPIRTVASMIADYHVEAFTAEEQALLAPHVTNLDRPVFALTNLPQVTAAALFARYSRSSKSLRRLLVDEFLTGAPPVADATAADAGRERASDLFGRVLAEYGDNSVAQLAGVHLACEQVSQPLAKAIEWGRLAAYLEQSTRYIPYTDRRDGHYRYLRDREVLASPLGATYLRAMDMLFDTYSELREPLTKHLDETLPEEADANARKRAIRALALDLMRGLLPAGTVSNVGMFASPQAYEQLVLRLRAHPLPEARAYAELINAELQQLIPEFLTRLDRPDRGGVWVDYLRETATSLAEDAGVLSPENEWGPPGVTLVDWDGDGEDRILAAALFPYSHASRSDCSLRCGRSRTPVAPSCSPPRWGIGATAATARDAGSSTVITRSRSSPITAHSATCSATACSRCSGRS